MKFEAHKTFKLFLPKSSINEYFPDVISTDYVYKEDSYDVNLGKIKDLHVFLYNII
jgi:hypothetical protein